MAERLHQLDRTYRLRMMGSLPGALLLVVLVGAVLSLDFFRRAEEKFAALPGPQRIHPLIDLERNPEDPQRTTAGPRPESEVDFVVEDIVYRDQAVVEPLAEIPADPPPATAPVRWTQDDLQTEIRTSGLPVLSRADFEVVHFERPVYPEIALKAGLEAKVEVMLLVDSAGQVTDARVVEPGRAPLFERSALDALSRMQFRPYLIGGKPSPFWVRIPVAFTLSG